MSLLIKEMVQTTWDYDYDNCINAWALEEFYNKVDDYFSEHGEEMTKLERELPHLNEGVISSTKFKNAYKINNCLVNVDYDSVLFNRYGMRVVMIGEEEEVRGLEKVVKRFSLLSNLYSTVNRGLRKKAREESYHEEEERREGIE